MTHKNELYPTIYKKTHKFTKDMPKITYCMKEAHCKYFSFTLN